MLTVIKSHSFLITYSLTNLMWDPCEKIVYCPYKVSDRDGHGSVFCTVAKEGARSAAGHVWGMTPYSTLIPFIFSLIWPKKQTHTQNEYPVTRCESGPIVSTDLNESVERQTTSVINLVAAVVKEEEEAISKSSD